MSTSTMDLDRMLKTALTERAAGDTDGLLEEILRTATVTSQRRSAWGPPAVPRRLALVTAAVLLLAALLGAVAVFSGLLPDPAPVLPQNGPITIQRGNPARLYAVDPQTQGFEELALGLAPGTQRPAPAPDGAAAAYARGKEVWIQHGEEAPRHVATCPDGICEGFEWSSDGAFVTIGWGYRAIQIVEVATGRLSTIATEGDVVAVSWAPDGQRLAIIESTSSLRVLGESLVRVSERDGSGSSLVFSEAGHRFADVAWSPDGTTLALLGLEFDADSALTTSVMTLTVGDGILRKVVELQKVGCAGRCPGYPQGVAWSPDQTQLAVVARNDLYVVNADGTDLRRIMERVNGSPVWVTAPDLPPTGYSTPRIVFTCEGVSVEVRTFEHPPAANAGLAAITEETACLEI